MSEDRKGDFFDSHCRTQTTNWISSFVVCACMYPFSCTGWLKKFQVYFGDIWHAVGHYSLLEVIKLRPWKGMLNGQFFDQK